MSSTSNRFEALRFREDVGLESRQLPSHSEDRAKAFRLSLLSRGIAVTREIFPALHSAFLSVEQQLKLSNPIDGFVFPDPVFNASCARISEGDGFSVIVSSGLVEALSVDEMKYVIGHEVGHYLFDHHLINDPESANNPAEALGLLRLSRAAEISADRIGFICCPEENIVAQAMIKTASGLSSRHIRFDTVSYLRQLRELKGVQGAPSELLSTHPMFPLRLRAALWFSMSQPYYDFIERNEEAPFAGNQLDDMIEKDFAEVTGFLMDGIKDHNLHNARLWGVLALLSVDNVINNEEQEIFRNIFDDDTGERALSFLKGQGKEVPKIIAERLDSALVSCGANSHSEKSELMDNLETVASVSSGKEPIRLELLGSIACKLGLKREVCIRPWSEIKFS